MTILLIAPSSGHWRGLGRKALFNGKTFRFSMLSLLSVAALTPDGHHVRIVDEQLDEIPWDAPVDLVGITVMTATAPRAWEICDRFGERGVPVVVGGFHPTFNLDEALEHADAVVQGTAGGAWAQVVADTAAGRLQRVYRGDPDKRFYSPWRITKRLTRWLGMPSGLTRAHIPLYLNVAYWGRQFQFGVTGYNPARHEASGRSSTRAVVAGRP